LSDRLLEIQRPIRVLDAIHWDDRIRSAFFDDPAAPPPVDADYYRSRALGFDPDVVETELTDLIADIDRRLTRGHPETELLRRTCDAYLVTVAMLASRGTPAFGPCAAALYGLPSDRFHDGGPTVSDFADRLRAGLGWVEGTLLVDDDDDDIDADEAVVQLQQRLDESMGEGLVNVVTDDGIVADAAAGATTIKLRSDASFSAYQLDQLEAHEGWVHVGTTLNGLAQPWCTFLGKAAPPTTVTQEGLATLTELVGMRSHPDRLQRIVDRIDGIALAGDGATFSEVAEHFRTQGRTLPETWALTARIFRGSVPHGPPFTKDLAYGKGLVQTYGYVRIAVQQGRPERLPMLFAGKLDLADVGLVNQLIDEELVSVPTHVPPPFRDPRALVASMVFSRFLRELDFDSMTDTFGSML
jgi:uncharacterized protein (TIGR02421 family)